MIESHEERFAREFFGPEPVEEFNALPDRPISVVICAYVEDDLSELIAARLPDNQQAKELSGLDRFVSLSQLIKLARAIGIIGDDLRDVLDWLAKVRNHYAHKPNPSDTHVDAQKWLLKLQDLYLTRFVESETAQLDTVRRSRILEELKRGVATNGTGSKELLMDIYLDVRSAFACIRYLIATEGRVPSIEPKGVMHHCLFK